MKRIPLTRGLEAIVDDDVYEWASKLKWHAHIGRGGLGSPYAKRKAHGGGNSRLLHREIVSADSGQVVDHINGDTLDNRRDNLRICTDSQNKQNVPKRSTSSSKFKGVSWQARDKRWVASIRKERKTRHLGVFRNEEDAARAYDAAARIHFGSFARLNFPNEGEQYALSEAA